MTLTGGVPMRQDPFYVSALLSQRLEQLLSAPLTLVEAPAGFGKTAAVRHALRALPSEAVHWHTALSDSGEDSFFWLARQLAALDPALDLALFSSRHVQTATRLSALRSAAPLYLVLDNVPSQEAPWTVSLFHTLAQRAGPVFHVPFHGDKHSPCFWAKSAVVICICGAGEE